nr:reverse transcriptase domain-containing protein [Tanacetum cinerariifolium]
MQTQTSNALHNAIMEAGGKDRPPMLAPVAEGSSETTTKGCMKNYKNVLQDIRDQLNAKAKDVQIILTGIDNDIYSTFDAYPNACEMWKAIERLKQGESINVQDFETNLYWKFGKFTSRDGESLESYYSRFYKMMNDLVRNQCDVTNHQVNVQFLLQLQPEWQRLVTLVKQSQELKTELEAHYMYMAHIQEVTPDIVDNFGPIFDVEPLQKVELKDLPPHLEYAFLEGDDNLPVIIVKDLSVEDMIALITVLKLHNVSALTILFLPDLSPTCMTLELADHSISRSVGVAEDVYVKVGTFYFPADFVVVDFNADPRVPLILKRSFLKTERALIDVFEGKLTFRVGKEAITFNLNQTSRYSANYNDMTAKHIYVIDMACEEYLQEVLGFSDVIASGNPTPYYDPIVSTTSSTLTPFENSDFLLEEVDEFLALEDDPTSPEVDQSYLDIEGDIIILKAFMNDDPSLPLPNQEN